MYKSDLLLFYGVLGGVGLSITFVVLFNYWQPNQLWLSLPSGIQEFNPLLLNAFSISVPLGALLGCGYVGKTKTWPGLSLLLGLWVASILISAAVLYQFSYLLWFFHPVVLWSGGALFGSFVIYTTGKRTLIN